MVEDGGNDISVGTESAEEFLSHARTLIPIAIEKAREVKGFTSRWKVIRLKMEQIPSRLSDLSSHPFFLKNTLCKEQMQAVLSTLNEAIRLAEMCLMEKYKGKLQMQSDLDALSCKLDLNLRDCGLLMKTGVLGEVTLASSKPETDTVTDTTTCNPNTGTGTRINVRELLARLQIGHLEAKHKALDTLVEVMKEDEKMVLTLLGRSHIAALVNLLTASSPRIREKTVTVICSLAESGTCESWLVKEGVIPPLVRLIESGSSIGRERAAITLQRMSMVADTARSIAGDGGIRPLISACQSGDSILQSSAACALKNLSAVPELRRTLADEGIVKLMVNLLDCAVLLGCKEYAAECLQNLTLRNDELRRIVILEHGIQTLLAYLDGPSPQEPAMGAVKNLVGSVPVERLVELGLVPRLVHVLKCGSLGAQRAAGLVVSQICSPTEVKKLVGLARCLPLLVKMLETKPGGGANEVAAQAIASLVMYSNNRREIRKNDKSVPNLVQLLDPNPNNSAKKYAVLCLLSLSSSKKCKKLMISYGAIGYLKKLTEMDVPGAKKLVERLERGKVRSMFGK